MDEGDNLEDPVSARIDILSKEFNPTGFEKLEKEEKIETEFRGHQYLFFFRSVRIDEGAGRSERTEQGGRAKRRRAAVCGQPDAMRLCFPPAGRKFGFTADQNYGNIGVRYWRS